MLPNPAIMRTRSPHQLSSLIKISIEKDERIEHIDSSKDLIEILQIIDFTFEKILKI